MMQPDVVIPATKRTRAATTRGELVEHALRVIGARESEIVGSELVLWIGEGVGVPYSIHLTPELALEIVGRNNPPLRAAVPAHPGETFLEYRERVAARDAAKG